jgi:uncharacterized protein (TIGR02449 family)
MDDIIQNLETRIKKMLQQFGQLTDLNLALSQTKAQITREKESLIAKHRMAISQIETMVSRLKSIEKAQ